MILTPFAKVQDDADAAGRTTGEAPPTLAQAMTAQAMAAQAMAAQAATQADEDDDDDDDERAAAIAFLEAR
jgi:hypothetical protein